MFVIWIASIIALAIEYGTVWLVLLIVTTIYLAIRGIIFIGFDFDDLF